jgi:hypothetical protein
MNLRLVPALLPIVVMATPASAAAQTVSAEVTLKVPVNLTQFGPDVSKARVGCNIRSDAITNGDANRSISKLQEVPMSGGQLVTTVSVTFSFTNLDNPTGKTAIVTCSLDGFSTSKQTWLQFTGGATIPDFKTNGSSLGLIDGSFVW